MKILCLFLLPHLLQAQSLDQVRTRLATLAGNAPLLLQVERQSWSRELKKDARPEHAWAKARIEALPTGARVVPGSETTSTPAKGEETPRSLGAREVRDILSAGEILQKTLAEARLESETQERHHDQPSKHFRFSLPLEDEAEAKKHMKEAWRSLDLWVAPDGTPQAALEAFKIKGRVLFVSIEAGARIRRDYRILGDRLVMVLEDKEARGSGMGQGSEGHTLLTAAPL